MKNTATFHTAIYSATNFLLVIAGLITFPLITRMMSVEEYGLLNLISLTIMVFVGLGKAGLQTSIVRFGSEARSGTKDFKKADVYLTALTSMFVIVVLMQIIWMMISQFLPLSVVGDERVYLIFIVTSLLIVSDVIASGVHNIFISEKKSLLISVFHVISKYSLIFIIVPGLIFAHDKILAFYFLSSIHGIFFAIVSIYICHRYFSIFRGKISITMNRRLLAYGLPLVGYEILRHVFAYGDRVQISYFLGAEALGYYAAASNLCMYIQFLFVTSMLTAVTPMYMDYWEKEGKQATEDFIALVMRYYLCLAIPAAFGVAAVGLDLLNFLAGEKYAEGYRAIPFIIVGMLIEGVAVLVAAGLAIGKQTKLMMGIMVSAAVLNIGLNPILIPNFGFEGAAAATLISFIFYAGVNYYFGRRVLILRFDPQPIMIYFAAGLMMYLAISLIDLPTSGLRLIAKIGIGGLIYTILVLMLDRDLRQLAASYVKPAWSMLMQRST